MDDKTPKTSAEIAHEKALGSRLDEPGIELGPWASYDLKNDPKRLVFVLSRYKFVAKMLAGKQRVMEVGCGDGLGLPIVADAVGELIATDWDARPLDNIAGRLPHLTNVRYRAHDHCAVEIDEKVDAIYSVDVIEHIDPATEEDFLRHQVACLPKTGVMLVGTPNITASSYASPQSEEGHINLKDFNGLKDAMAPWFENVFMFGMNDEVLHTGYGPMCHYIWALGAGVR